jgi:hypothetical protein
MCASKKVAGVRGLSESLKRQDLVCLFTQWSLRTMEVSTATAMFSVVSVVCKLLRIMRTSLKIFFLSVLFYVLNGLNAIYHLCRAFVHM